MTRKEAVDLYTVLRELFLGDMDKEVSTPFRLMRLEMKKVWDEYEEMRKEISQDTKPKDFKEGDDTTAWVKEFKPVMDAWLAVEIPQTETHLLSEEQYFDLMACNRLMGFVEDILHEKLVKS